MIRKVHSNDTEHICEIYNHYVNETFITFEEKPVSVEAMQNRMDEVTESFPWLVYEKEEKIIGYAYASKWKGRCAYRYTAESTVYLAHDVVGKGIGSQLYSELIAILRNQNIHSVIGGIALPNPASIALHEKMGFQRSAHFKEVGWKFDQWIDVGYWELILSDEKPE